MTDFEKNSSHDYCCPLLGSPMGIEIERRFLVDEAHIDEIIKGATKSLSLSQWYPPIGTIEMIPERQGLAISSRILIEGIPDNEWREVCTLLSRGSGARIRIRKPVEGWLTIKGKWEGVLRKEFEWPVDAAITQQLAERDEWPGLSKRRLLWTANNSEDIWEIDVFNGAQEGLIIAEIELGHENQHIELPTWVGEEITGIDKWGNCSLAMNGIPKS